MAAEPTPIDPPVRSIYRYNLELPMELGYWLDDEATRRNRESRSQGKSRVTKKDIITESLERERDRVGGSARARKLHGVKKASAA